MQLRTFQGYHSLTLKEKNEICNGAGAAGDWRSAFIPNTLYGLDCTEVFNLHDYAYHVGTDKELADMQMLINLNILIGQAGGWLTYLRRVRSVAYYMAVHNFGDEAFNVRG